MDQQNIDLQNRIANITEKRMDRFDEEQRKHGELLATIVVQTKDIPNLIQRVEYLEAAENKRTGAMILFGLLWSFLEIWFHYWRK